VVRQPNKVTIKINPAGTFEYQLGKGNSEDFSSRIRKKVQHGLVISRIPQDLAVKIWTSGEHKRAIPQANPEMIWWTTLVKSHFEKD